MGITNAGYWIEEYVDDFGNKHPNLKFKIAATAPKFNDVKGVAGYKERSSGVSCGTSTLFKPRHLKVVFNSGRTIQFIVPKADLIDDMVKILKPSILDNIIPGEGNDEAACIHLVGEKWKYVPNGLLGIAKSAFKTGAITGVQNTGSQKVSYLYKYQSEIPTVGEIETSFAVHIDSETLRNCQVEGMTGWTRKEDGESICNASSLGISPRHFVIKTILEYDTNGIIPGGKTKFKAIRQAPVSGESGFLFSDKAKDVAKNIAKCAHCLGWNGESADNIHLLISGSNLVG